MGRWLIVRTVARGLRGGICGDHMEQILRKRFPWRDDQWRQQIIKDAWSRNLHPKIRA